MRKSNYLKNKEYRLKNSQIDQQLYHQLRGLKLVSSTDALSELCGKTKSYYRSMKAKRIGLKVGSLATLREELALRMDEENNPRHAVVIGYGMTAVERAIREKVLLEQKIFKNTNFREFSL